VDDLIALLERCVCPALPLTPSLPLISTGLLDSFSVAALLTAIEVRYGIAIDPADIGVDNFDTPAQMIGFIDARR
jgi:acyl carrier protein